jgi:hypothetical protein
VAFYEIRISDQKAEVFHWVMSTTALNFDLPVRLSIAWRENFKPTPFHSFFDSSFLLRRTALQIAALLKALGSSTFFSCTRRSKRTPLYLETRQ